MACCVPPSIYAGWRIVGGGPLISGGWLSPGGNRPAAPRRRWRRHAWATRTYIEKRFQEASPRRASTNRFLSVSPLEAPPYRRGAREQADSCAGGCIAPAALRHARKVRCLMGPPVKGTNQSAGIEG